MSFQLFHILKTRIRQLGGLRLVREYARLGVLWLMVKAMARNPLSRQSYKNAYAVALRRVEVLLQEKYRPVMREIAEQVRNEGGSTGSPTVRREHKRTKKIWFCWLQGLEAAPEVVKACYNSLVRHLGVAGRGSTGSPIARNEGYEIIVIDGKNWREYVELPEYVVEKWLKGLIPAAHFSDLLRLELLIRYGGTWIDSTVLCTGVNNDNENANVNYLDTDLFMFQYTQPGSSEWGGIGNWFISACADNPVLTVLREMLLAYWKDYDCVLDYYIFHLFFSMLRDVFPEEIGAMPYAYAPRSLALVHHWGEPFDKAKWQRLTERVCFHKLTYMKDKVPAKVEGTYYEYILNDNDKGN